MKRALLISFVLVFALASVALADVNFGGSLTVTVEQKADDGEQLKLGEGKFTVTPGYEFNVTASNEDAPDWKVALNIKRDDKFDLGSYHLNLDDQLFTLDFWGKGRGLSGKSDVMGFVTAAAKQDEDGKLRVASKTLDPLAVTLDYTPGTALVVFGEFDLDEYPMGVVVRRAYPDTDSVVGYGTFDLESVTIKAAAGATVSDFAMNRLAYGADLSVPVTDEVTLSGRYEMRRAQYAGGKAPGQLLEGGVRYKEDPVDAGAKLSLSGTAADITTQTLSADVSYSFNEDAKLKVDGSTVTNNVHVAGARHNTLSANAELSLPPLMDRVVGWFKAGMVVNSQGVHQVVDRVETVKKVPSETTAVVAGVLAKAEGKLTIEASEKLNLIPSLAITFFTGGNNSPAAVQNYRQVKAEDELVTAVNTSGSIVELALGGDYQIGRSDTKMGFEVKQTLRSYDAQDNSQLAKAWVKVTF